ncbi:uncharacterized protein VNE69_12091 [Vairimorpha necatrix]|uniref:Uncharacterized protein n=1 Tax=Vairimorpha necatrix TaxID=6039 RepID=A0AAX4JI40_9MICR
MNRYFPGSYIRVYDHCIRFRINIKNLYCFFELNDYEAADLKKIVTIYEEKWSNDFSSIFDTLCKGEYVDLDLLLSKDMPKDKIKEDYQIELYDAEVEKYMKHKYRSKNKSKSYLHFIKEDKFFNKINESLSEHCRKEIENLIKRTYDLLEMENFEEIELFGYLIKKNTNSLVFLTRRILNDKNSGLKILLAHFLYKNSVIFENDFNILIREENEKERNGVINAISDHLTRQKFIRLHLLFIFLFIEAERFINENHENMDDFFQNLKKLDKQAETFYNIYEPLETNHKIGIDLLKLMNFMKKKLIDDPKKSNVQILCALISLFTGSKTNYMLNLITGEYEMFEKNKIIRRMGLDPSKVEEFNENIRKEVILLTRSYYQRN